jgi:hypothetical protein
LLKVLFIVSPQKTNYSAFIVTKTIILTEERMKKLFLLLAVASMLVSAAIAQSTTGRLIGTVSGLTVYYPARQLSLPITKPDAN